MKDQRTEQGFTAGIPRAQETMDQFYWATGPCCAGCDHWMSVNSSAGECRAAPPMPGADRLALLGIEKCSLQPGAGHPFTKRDHHCGTFTDRFDWASLPLAYRHRVGCPA